MKMIGAKRLNKQLRSLPPAVEAELRKVVQKSGKEFVTVARALVPVDSGDLKNSIEVKYKNRGMTAEITAGGATADGIIKAKTVEGGRKPSSKSGAMAAQPFMRRTAQHLGKKIRGRHKRALAKAVKRIANG